MSFTREMLVDDDHRCRPVEKCSPMTLTRRKVQFSLLMLANCFYQLVNVAGRLQAAHFITPENYASNSMSENKYYNNLNYTFHVFIRHPLVLILLLK